MSNSSRDFFKSIVRYSGHFNYKEFYDLIVNIMAANNFVLDEDNHSQKEDDRGLEIEIRWPYYRVMDDYVKFHIQIYYLLRDVKEVIIKKGDKEIKTYDGNCMVIISGKIETDWQNRWEQKGKFIEKMRSFYERYLLAPVINDYIGKMGGLIALIEGEIKSFFEIPR